MVRPKKLAAKPVEAPAVVEEKKMAPILEAFGKVYVIFLAEQRAKLEELKAQFPDDPAVAKYFDDTFRDVFYNDEFTEAFFSHWVNYGVLPKAKQGEKIKADRLRGAKTTREKMENRKAAFRALFLDELKEHGTKYTKAGLIESALTRFGLEHGKLSERTAWNYVKDLKNSYCKG
jgi:hypothetical protein